MRSIPYFLSLGLLLGGLALAPYGTAQAADMDSITEKIGSIFHKGKDKAADLLDKGGELGKDLLNEGKVLRDEALRKGDEMLDSIDKSLDGKPRTGDVDKVYTRLAVRNQCARSVTIDIAELKDKPDYKAGEVPARSQRHIEAWKGITPPKYTCTLHRQDDSAPQTLPLAELLKHSEKSVVREDGVTFHNYIYTLCKDNAPLDTSPDSTGGTGAPVSL